MSSDILGVSIFPVEGRLALVGLQPPARADGADPKPSASDGLPMRRFAAFQGKSLDQKVQELADREELRELIADYANRVARGLSAADLFTEDGAFLLRVPDHPVQEVRGREAIEAMYAAVRPDDEHPLPMIHNYQFVIDGDRAVGLCANELRIAIGGESIIGSGYYEDQFRREHGNWKFVVRDATFFHWVPIQQGWARPEPAR
jgi:hypothetical protein